MIIRNDRMMQKQEPGRVDVKSLVSRLQAGEPSAVRVFVKMYGPRVHGYLRCLVHSPETAEDLTQEVLIKSYQKCGQIETAEKFETWLFTLARNMAYKEMKRKRYRVEFTRDVEWFDTRDGGNADHPARNFGADEWTRNPWIKTRGIALVSIGPDRRDSFGVFRPFPAEALPPLARQAGILHPFDTQYDPTNGTVSGGDIFGFAGELSISPGY